MKKKLIILTLLTIFMVLDVVAQKNKSQVDTSTTWGIYRNAMQFSDLDVAKYALFELLSAQPENQALYDSLAQLYFSIGAYNQSLQACQKAEMRDGIKEIMGYSYRNLGDTKTALPLFEELYQSTNSIDNGYQVATMQFAMKRYGECLETIAKIKSNTSSKTSKVVITTESGETMSVSYLAAAENLSGVLYSELGKPDLAKKSFELALAEEPDFTLAKKNLQNLQVPTNSK